MSDCVYPCPRGFFGDSQKPCTRAPAVVTKYQKRISGPLPDRMDIHIEVPRVDYEKLSGDRLGETSETIRKRVQAARDLQNQRFTVGEAKDLVCNADMRLREVRYFAAFSLKVRGGFGRGEEIQCVRLAEALQDHPNIMTG